jgi:hypothetical protein
VILLRRLLFATYFFEVGLLLLIVPWSTFWDRNLLLESWPLLYGWTRSEFVRGAVSGLGVVNLGAGMLELAAAWRTRGGMPDGQALISPLNDAGRGHT